MQPKCNAASSQKIMQRGEAALHAPGDKKLLVGNHVACAYFPRVSSCQTHRGHLLLQFRMTQSSVTYCALKQETTQPHSVYELLRTLTRPLRNSLANNCILEIQQQKYFLLFCTHSILKIIYKLLKYPLSP